MKLHLKSCGCTWRLGAVQNELLCHIWIVRHFSNICCSSKTKKISGIKLNFIISGTFNEKQHFLDFAEFGCFCQLDLFGSECSWYQLNPAQDMPSDAQRVDMFSWMNAEGKITQLLASHDIHTRHRLVSKCMPSRNMSFQFYVDVNP